ncbi:MAG: bifunctional diguanylate cyclase/phosphodiesterase [Gammaproteobacteria bacterium]
MSERLRNAVRHSDVVARHGGDEFVAVVDRLGRDEAAARDTAMEVAQKIRAALHAPYMLTGAANPYHASASIGVALYRGGHHGVDELLKHADVAMFEAKELGRNRVCMFSTQRQAAIDSRTALTDALRGALERDELRLHYQPQVAASGELVGAEALLRWLPAGGAAISPGSFIPVAEESGLILPIGAWVLETACRHIQQLEFCQPSERFAVAVNISPRQFSDAGLLDNVKAVLEKTGVNPRRLKLEVTESSLFEDRRRATRILQALRDLGVRIELDDFGTGYSSLISLKKLPLDTLKLDGSLIKDLDNESGSAIVRAAIAMGKALGLSIVAEGVETVEQRNYLTRQDCDVLQGFLFARPMPFEALEPLVAQRHVYRGKPGPLSAAAFDERHIA